MRSCVLFFLFAYFYCLWRIQPSLVHFLQEPFFSTSGAFLQAHLSKPAGLAGYVAALAATFFQFDWCGAALITLFAVTASIAYYRCLPRHGAPAGGMGVLIPALALVWAHGHYDYSVAHTVGAVFALAALALLLSAIPRPSTTRHVVFVALMPAVYWAAGGALALFALLYLVCTYGALQNNASGNDTAGGTSKPAVRLGYHAVWGGAILVLTGTLPALYALAFTETAPALLYGSLLPKRWGGGLSWEVFVFYAALLLTGMAVAVTASRSSEKAAQPVVARVLGQARSKRFAVLFSPALWVVVGIALVVVSFDGDRKVLIRMEYLASQKRWDEYLDYARRHQDHPIYTGQRSSPAGRGRLAAVTHTTDRVLFHAGVLLEDLFSFPQMEGTETQGLMLADWDLCTRSRYLFFNHGVVLFELGRVNESEEAFHEAWSYHGDRPSIFRQLACLNIVKGRYEAARAFLTVLRQVPFHRKWAARMEANTDADPSLAWSKTLSWVRSANYTKDLPGKTGYGPQEPPLRLLLLENIGNRMAFEYLLASLLLEKNEEEIAKSVALLRRVGYARIPRHCEEAILAYMSRAPGNDVDLCGYTIRPETIQRFEQFSQISAQCGSNPEALWDALYEPFGNTYWFYDTFGLTGFSNAPISRQEPLF